MASARIEIERAPDVPHAARVRLVGPWTIADGRELWRRLHAPEIRGADAIELDLSGVEWLEGAAAALLLAARSEWLLAGKRVEFLGLSSEHAHALERYGCEDPAACLASEPEPIGILDSIGRGAAAFGQQFIDMLAFQGDLFHAIRRALRAPRTVGWRDLGKLTERAGADGAPIVLLINFLVGLIVALQAAYQLERFAAGIFVADLVGLSMTRELAPLMTAIVVGGRTGAAYAAELGTMCVSEEIDALRSMRIDPLRHLVIPRLLTLVLVTPLLTLGADIVGCFGGFLVATLQVGLAPETYLHSLREAVGPFDVGGGLIKSAVFAVTIGFVSCQRGLSTRGGASGVGSSTTAAVVTTLFALIVWDAVFTGLFNALGI